MKMLIILTCLTTSFGNVFAQPMNTESFEPLSPKAQKLIAENSVQDSLSDAAKNEIAFKISNQTSGCSPIVQPQFSPGQMYENEPNKINVGLNRIWIHGFDEESAYLPMEKIFHSSFNGHHDSTPFWHRSSGRSQKFAESAQEILGQTVTLTHSKVSHVVYNEASGSLILTKNPGQSNQLVCTYSRDLELTAEIERRRAEGASAVSQLDRGNVKNVSGSQSPRAPSSSLRK